MPFDRHASLAGKLLQKPAAVNPINLYVTRFNDLAQPKASGCPL
jgi:hypothetical protein